MPLKIHVDLDGCLGHGQCELVAPQLFRINGDGLVEVLRDAEEGERTALLTAIARCPERIITFTEEP